MKIALDAMGHDDGPGPLVDGAVLALREFPQISKLILTGDNAQLEALLKKHGCNDSRIEIVHTTQVVEMHDSGIDAVRKKKDSSVSRAIDLVKSGAAEAVVSAGNTGAAVAACTIKLRMLPGIDRPAIATFMPNIKDRFTCVLDLGANVDCSAEHLLQFAVMGSALTTATEGHAQPVVGLLNIGEEVIKGSEVIKRAGELLRAVAASGHLNYLGNVEGDDIFKGTVDVVVCDGFVGNVALKSNEGVAKMMNAMIRQEFERNLFTKLAALVAMPVLRRFKARVDPRRYNGAALLGLKGLVFKSHGGADAFSFGQALIRAHDAARNRLLDGVQDAIVGTMQALPPTGGESVQQAA